MTNAFQSVRNWFPGAGALLLFLCLCALLLISGCQTAPVDQKQRSSDVQDVFIDTPGVAGATCILTSATVGRTSVVTPGSITVDRSPEIIVANCSKRCYLAASAMISSEGQRLSNGSVVYSYPEKNTVQLLPAKSCDEPAAGNTGSPL
ncbi:MAG: hypothetical protein ACK5KM_00505 [Hyphomicrobiaceae bacterium]